MRRLGRALLGGASGLVIGIGALRIAPAPEVPVGPVLERVPAPAPIAPIPAPRGVLHPPTPSWAEAEPPSLDEHVAALEEDLGELLESPDWVEDVPPEHRAAAVREKLRQPIPGWPLGVSILAPLCPPEPCVITLRMEPDGFDDHGLDAEDQALIDEAEERVAAHLGFDGRAETSILRSQGMQNEPIYLRSLWWLPPGQDREDLRYDVEPRAKRARRTWSLEIAPHRVY